MKFGVSRPFAILLVITELVIYHLLTAKEHGHFNISLCLDSTKKA